MLETIINSDEEYHKGYKKLSELLHYFYQENVIGQFSPSVIVSVYADTAHSFLKALIPCAENVEGLNALKDDLNKIHQNLMDLIDLKEKDLSLE